MTDGYDSDSDVDFAVNFNSVQEFASTKEDDANDAFESGKDFECLLPMEFNKRFGFMNQKTFLFKQDGRCFIKGGDGTVMATIRVRALVS